MQNHTPARYFIHLEPDLEALTFLGTVRLSTSAADPISRIELDAVDLTVRSFTLRTGEDVIEARCTVEDGTLSVEFDHPVSGDFDLEIEYSGEINDLMAGFYRSRYSIDGEEKFLAVTQFEERDARRAFPCVDRPAAKAVFDIEILAPAGHTAIANTPEVSVVERPGGSRLFRFEPTPPMSTYLVFFGVGPFDIEVDDSWRVPIRVAVSPGKGKYALVSLEYARQSVSFLEEFTGFDYPLGKLDSIGVTDFAYGAMENFGAIVYRENYLLAYPDSTTRRETERMMGIAAHEIAHQWFGDVVSPADWRYVWLNEAFATFFGNVVTDHWYPQWRTMDQFVIGATSAAMGRDGLSKSVPIELESDEEVEIDASTAPIVYSKGASILRMIRGYYGDETFRESTRAFLQAFQFDAADTQQFLESFGSKLAAGGAGNAAALLSGWITQPGVPVISVSRRDGRLLLRQSRFSYLDDSKGTAESSALWSIPVTGRTVGASTAEIQLVLETAEGEVAAPSLPVKLNTEQTGYYRVFYEAEGDWDDLGRAAASRDLSALDRYGLIADMAAFVTAGRIGLDRHLSFLTSYYRGEDEFVVLSQISGSLTGYFELLGGGAAIAECSQAILGHLADELLAEPSDEEPYRNVLLRDAVLWNLFLTEGVTGGATKVRDAFRERFDTVREGGSIHPDLYPLTVRIALHEDPTVFGWIRDQLALDDVPEGRKVQLIAALSAVGDDSTARVVLDYVLTEIPDRNRLHFLRGAGGSPAIRRRLWGWFTDNFERLSQIHPYHLGSTIASVIPSGGLGHEDEVRAFIEEYRSNVPRVSKGVLDVSLDRLEINRRFVERET